VKVLVTGGAGFIGSHLAYALIEAGHEVRVLDNLSTGRRANLAGGADAELVEADVRCPTPLGRAMRGVEAVFHVAALPSVPRSYRDPVTTLACNAHGTANVVEAAIVAGAHTFVYSSSSSVYGDQAAVRKSEQMDPAPISPYAYSKLLGEKIAHAHGRRGDLRVVTLRYFNVFGPRQDPDSAYAAVIPRFIKAALEGRPVTVHGDGLQTRDFTYVSNVVSANLRALDSPACDAVFNVACGRAVKLTHLVEAISGLRGRPLEVVRAEPRAGDIRHSLADCRRAEALIGYRPEVDFDTGLRLTYEWFSGR
jgi:UDP-N-acetylglucosamine/UDP-N-acetyl-alpha-D-glucosaminouronate 4-epimerase